MGGHSAEKAHGHHGSSDHGHGHGHGHHHGPIFHRSIIHYGIVILSLLCSIIYIEYDDT